MSDVNSVRQNSRLAYTSDDNVNYGSQSQTGGVTGGDPSRRDYLVNYIQEVQRDIVNGNTQGGTLDQKKAWLQQALNMLHGEFPESSGWDPLAGQNPVGFQCDRAPTNTNHTPPDEKTGDPGQKYFEYREGKTTNIIIDRGDPNDHRPTIAKISTPVNGIYLPDNATDASFTYNKDTDTLTVEFTIDGKKTTLTYTDVKRSNFKLTIDAVNPDRIAKNPDGSSKIPAELSSKVKVKEYKGEGEEGATPGERSGDQPRIDRNGNPVFDGNSPSIYPATEGSGETISVRPKDKTATLNVNDGDEYVVFERKGGKIIAHVFNSADDVPRKEDGSIDMAALSSAAKENLEFNESSLKNGGLKIDIPPSQIEWTGDLKGADEHTLTSSVAGSKIEIISEDAIDARNFPAGSGDVKIEVGPQDKVEISKNSTNPPTYTVKVTKPGSTEPIVYTVDSDGLNSLTINGVAASRVTLKGLSASDTKKLNIGLYLGWINDPRSFSNQGGVGLVPTGKGQGEAIGVLKELSSAILSGDPASWNKVKDAINGWDADHGNDRVRKLMTALWYAAGGKPGSSNEADEMAEQPEAAARFKQLLQLLPPDVRDALRNKAAENAGELGEYEGGHDMFDSQDCVNILSSL